MDVFIISHNMDIKYTCKANRIIIVETILMLLKINTGIKSQTHLNLLKYKIKKID